MTLRVPGPGPFLTRLAFGSVSTVGRVSVVVVECLHSESVGRMAESIFSLLPVCLIGVVSLFALGQCGHFRNADGTPHDMFHDLHVPRNPPLYPTYAEVPKTSFTCEGKTWGYHADTEAQCQAYHLCQGKIVQSFLCPNATLFHDQFKACDQFYNVRCGVDLEDL